MFRFIISSCGVLAEAGALASASSTNVWLGAAAIVLGVAVWWTDVRPVVDRVVGCDL